MHEITRNILVNLYLIFMSNVEKERRIFVQQLQDISLRPSIGKET